MDFGPSSNIYQRLPHIRSLGTIYNFFVMPLTKPHSFSSHCHTQDCVLLSPWIIVVGSQMVSSILSHFHTTINATANHGFQNFTALPKMVNGSFWLVAWSPWTDIQNPPHSGSKLHPLIFPHCWPKKSLCCCQTGPMGGISNETKRQERKLAPDNMNIFKRAQLV